MFESSQHFSYKLCINKLVSRLNSHGNRKNCYYFAGAQMWLSEVFTTRCLFKTFGSTANGQFAADLCTFTVGILFRVTAKVHCHRVGDLDPIKRTIYIRICHRQCEMFTEHDASLLVWGIALNSSYLDLLSEFIAWVHDVPVSRCDTHWFWHYSHLIFRMSQSMIYYQLNLERK